jgi:hypothetical protein
MALAGISDVSIPYRRSCWILDALPYASRSKRTAASTTSLASTTGAMISWRNVAG